jgi:hypothetical protein
LRKLKINFSFIFHKTQYIDNTAYEVMINTSALCNTLHHVGDSNPRSSHWYQDPWVPSLRFKAIKSLACTTETLILIIYIHGTHPLPPYNVVYLRSNSPSTL